MRPRVYTAALRRDVRAWLDTALARGGGDATRVAARSAPPPPPPPVRAPRADAIVVHLRRFATSWARQTMATHPPAHFYEAVLNRSAHVSEVLVVPCASPTLTQTPAGASTP